MRSPLPFPCVPDRPYKISCLLVQVGTLSFSHPSFGVIYVLFIYPIRESLVKFSLDLAV